MPALGESVQQHATAVVEADAARVAAAEKYRAGAAAIDQAIDAVAAQTEQTMAFLDSLDRVQPGDCRVCPDGAAARHSRRSTRRVARGQAMKPLWIGPLRIDPPVLQAPMAGFTNYAYRQMIRRFGGVGLPATEMVSARGFLHIGARGERVSRSAVGRQGRAAAAGRADLGQRPRHAGGGGPAAGRGVSSQRDRHQFRLPGSATFPKRPRAGPICCAIPIAWARLWPAWRPPAGRRR